MRRTFFGLLVVSLFVWSAPVAAGKLYKWVDEKGNVTYSDKVPPDAAKLARKEMNDRGVTLKRVERAKTQEEIASEAAQKVLKAEARKLAEAQAQADSALTLSYSTEADLLRAREQELGVLDANMVTAKLTMGSQEKNLSDLLAHAADFERNSKPIPKTVTDSIATVRGQIESQKKTLADREAAKVTVRKDYDAKLIRWRELSAAEEKSTTPAQ